MDTYRCRPCQRDFAATSLSDIRRCPQCGGPLLSHAQLHDHAHAAKASLDKLRRLSAMTMAGSAFLMLVMQGVLSLWQPADVAIFFNRFALGAASISLVAAWLWLTTSHRFWMVSGAVLLQMATAVFFFVVMGVGQQLGGELHAMLVRWELFVAAMPVAGALLAWHQFRSYCQLLRLEQGKARGSRLLDCPITQ